jgi:hypothetical protein
VVSDDLVCVVKAKVREYRQFTILLLSLHSAYFKNCAL